MRRHLTASLAVLVVVAFGGCSCGGDKSSPPACASGLAQCDVGCVDLSTDNAHCGSCANVCAGARVCAGGTCELTCGTGGVQCGDVCADVQSDLANCGACGNACTAGTLCLAGACQLACEPLTARCGSGATAVCADLAANANHCGTCATACDPSQACEAGACVTPCPAGEARCNGTCVTVSVRAAGLGLPGVHASPTSASPVAIATRTANDANTDGVPDPVDADRDGIPDLIVTESTSSTAGQIEVLRGATNGTFAPFATPSIVSLPFAPTAVAVGDINGDTFADLVVGTADATVTSVVILAGDGAGGFSEAALPALAAGAGPRAVALADLDWDGDLDLVVGDGASVASSNLKIFFNDGTATFGAAPGAVGDPRPANLTYGVLADVRQIAVGQFDSGFGDDLLVISAGATNAGGTVFINNGSGGFTAPQGNAFTFDGVPTATVATPLGGLALDWAIAEAASNRILVFVNGGDGVALSQELFDVAEPLGLAADDLDGDGKVDLLSANGAASAAYFHRNLGPAAGGVAFAQPVRLPAGDHPDAVAVTSVAAATWVLTANELGRNVSSALVTVAGFVAPSVYPLDVSADAVTLGRFDTDAWLDFAAASAWTNEVRVFHQARPAPPVSDFSAFTSIALPINAAPSAIAAGDVDADGADDLVVAMRGLAQVGLLYGDGAGAFEPLAALDVGSEPSAVLLAQLDGYAGLDVATADAGSNRVTLIMSTARRAFAVPVALATGPTPVALAAVDLDSRGCLDLVSANSGDGTLSVFRCLPAAPGTFAAPLTVAACAGARSIVAASVDADVLPDLIVGCTEGVVVLTSLGSGAFTTGTPFSPGLDPAALKVADLDGDGVNDLVVASPRDGGVALLRGTANDLSPFSAPEIFTAGGSPVGLAIGAVDGDVQLDVVAAVTRPSSAWVGAGASVLRGTCKP
ncbi:MAG: FG-GAP-like repeat-containing protein [Anaeromyxobacteraceae bacterium]